MVSEVRIYVEGGGQQSDTRAAVREGFSRFLGSLRDLARDKGLGWYLTACGSREATFAKFSQALSLYPSAFNLLLVDAETRVSKTPRQHLKDTDGWSIAEALNDRCHLMAQVAEAWLIADPEALAGFYGQGFLPKALPRRPDVEEIPKNEVLSALERATGKCRTKGAYHKIHHGPEILKRASPARVRQRARHCDRLFTTLETLLRS